MFVGIFLCTKQSIEIQFELQYAKEGGSQPRFELISRILGSKVQEMGPLCVLMQDLELFEYLESSFVAKSTEGCMQQAVESLDSRYHEAQFPQAEICPLFCAELLQLARQLSHPRNNSLTQSLDTVLLHPSGASMVALLHKQRLAAARSVRFAHLVNLILTFEAPRAHQGSFQRSLS